MWKAGIPKRQFNFLRFGIVSSVSREFLKSVVRHLHRQISVYVEASQCCLLTHQVPSWIIIQFPPEDSCTAAFPEYLMSTSQFQELYPELEMHSSITTLLSDPYLCSQPLLAHDLIVA